jgi:hypothetical protein
MSDLEHTTVWYCSPYCLMIDTLRFDGAGLSHQDIAQLRAALTSAVQAIPRTLTQSVPMRHAGPRVAALG